MEEKGRVRERKYKRNEKGESERGEKETREEEGEDRGRKAG